MNRDELPPELKAAIDHIENCIVRTVLTKETTSAWDTICASIAILARERLSRELVPS